MLAVMDILEGVSEDTSVQINFHIDSPLVMADSEKSFAVSVDERANIGVYSDRRLKPTLVPAKISTKNDVWHDTMIARFEAEHLEEGKHAFLSVAYPTPEGEKVPEITEIFSEFENEETVRFGFSVEQRSYELKLSENILSMNSTNRK